MFVIMYLTKSKAGYHNGLWSIRLAKFFAFRLPPPPFRRRFCRAQIGLEDNSTFLRGGRPALVSLSSGVPV